VQERISSVLDDVRQPDEVVLFQLHLFDLDWPPGKQQLDLLLNPLVNGFFAVFP
jgi:hypothetical protein